MRLAPGGAGLVSFSDVPETAKLKLVKTSAVPSVTDNNSNYSLNGAVYGVYTDSACTDLFGKLTTNAKGETNVLTVTAQPYYVKEISASKGFTVDETVYTVVPTLGSTYVLEVKENPVPILKTVYSYENSADNGLCTVGWAVEAGDATDLHGTARFYDLVPLGAEYKTGSVIVYADGVKVAADKITVNTTPNFRDSGRTLLTVDINASAYRYRMTYQSLSSYDSIADYGTHLLNSVAFESGNPSIKNGYPDNGGNITDSALMTDLDPTTNAAKFLYAEATYDMDVEVPLQTGPSIKVRGLSGEYRDADEVNQNGACEWWRKRSDCSNQNVWYRSHS